ncbi:unnamed protein product, partial [Symbiodinium pilosum]
MGDEAEQPNAAEEGDPKAQGEKTEEVNLEVKDAKGDVVEVEDDDEADKGERQKKARTVAVSASKEEASTNGDAKEAGERYLAVRHLPSAAKHRDWFDKYGSAGKIQHVSFFGRSGDPLSAVLEAATSAEAAALVKELNGLEVDGATVDAKLIDQ